MRPLVSLFAVLASVCIAAGLGASPPTSTTSRLRGLSGGASVPPHDSADFIAFFREVVTYPTDVIRRHSDLPALPAENVQFAGAPAQCDSVAARFQRFAAARGDTLPLLPVSLLRVGTTRWVGDPHVADGQNERWWIILVSTLTVLHIFKTSY